MNKVYILHVDTESSDHYLHAFDKKLSKSALKKFLDENHPEEGNSLYEYWEELEVIHVGK